MDGGERYGILQPWAKFDRPKCVHASRESAVYSREGELAAFDPALSSKRQILGDSIIININMTY